MLLSNYSYSAGRELVGNIICREKGLTLSNIKVNGIGADVFGLKGNQLFVKKPHNKTAAKWYDVEITAETAQGTLKDTFRIVNDQFIRNKVIAHRGAWKNTGASENSIASLKHAVELGCQGSEFDVHMSSDSELFIHHDPDVNGISIAGTPAARLAQLKLSNGENLPTLQAYIKEGMQQNKTKLILEIKPSELGKQYSIALTHKVLNLIRDMKAEGWTEYISFDYDVCLELKKLDPYARIAYLNGDKSPEELAEDGLYGLDYHLGVLQSKADWISTAHQKNLTVNVWTVNKADDMDWMLEHKVDFITTNEPELLLKKIKGK